MVGAEWVGAEDPEDAFSAAWTAVGNERTNNAAKVMAPLRKSDRRSVARGVNVTRDERRERGCGMGRGRRFPRADE
jgi:hypothetical protein